MNLRRLSQALALAVVSSGISFAVLRVIQHREGYKDTPILPGQKWHVHDSDRPYPKEVTPGAKMGDAPSDAVVLFDGTDLSKWTQGTGRRSGAPKWMVRDGYVQVAPGTGNLVSKEKFGDCQLHIEWQEDPSVTGHSQERGNSGVFLMGVFEVQVLDSYKDTTYADGQAGAIYGQWPPLVNPIRPEGQWNVYDIVFTAPKWNGGKLVEPAYETIFFNGVLVHNHQKLNGPSAHRAILPYSDPVSEGPILLQDHGPKEPLRFRNIWVRRLKDYDQP